MQTFVMLIPTRFLSTSFETSIREATHTSLIYFPPTLARMKFRMPVRGQRLSEPARCFHALNPQVCLRAHTAAAVELWRGTFGRARNEWFGSVEDGKRSYVRVTLS